MNMFAFAFVALVESHTIALAHSARIQPLQLPIGARGISPSASDDSSRWNSRQPPSFQVLRMEDLRTTRLTEEQLQICQERLNGKTDDEILANHPANDSHPRLCFCFWRTLMEYRFAPHCFCWEIGVTEQTYGLELGFAAPSGRYGASYSVQDSKMLLRK
jgi:hypothetical protein